MSKDFFQQIQTLKSLIDGRVSELARELEAVMRVDGEIAVAPLEPFTNQYVAGGKRFRGIATVMGYELMGGKNREMILTIAAAVEGFHSYILAFDDMQDESDIRHGVPTVHRGVEKVGKLHDWPNVAADGSSLTYNVALSAAHFMSNVILGIHDVDQDKRIQALRLLNTTMLRTASGQTLDLVMADLQQADKNHVEQTMYLKTALYTVTMPLQLGMILAGSSNTDLQKIEAYGRHVGRVFQLIDDVLPYSSGDIGKPRDGDLKEGKITYVLLEAYERASADNVKYLRRCLGDKTLSDEAFRRCVEILHESGAVEATLNSACESYQQALRVLDECPKTWDVSVCKQLRELADYALHRSK